MLVGGKEETNKWESNLLIFLLGFKFFMRYSYNLLQFLKKKKGGGESKAWWMHFVVLVLLTSCVCSLQVLSTGFHFTSSSFYPPSPPSSPSISSSFHPDPSF